MTATVTITALAGCSSASTASIASAAPSGSRATPATSEAGSDARFQDYLASERAFATCMRAAGLDVSDPEPDGTQRAPYKEQIKGTGLSKSQQTAIGSCQTKLLPDPRPQSYPLLSDEEFAFSQKMAVCFRQHGVPEYPDPVRETDPSLAGVKHYDAALDAVPTDTTTFREALNDCSVAVTGHTGIG
ncbi:hypothetical protein KIH74_05815 [Kineosporia sp. J2-2]|uniref:Lipoprotein n=1 Tax=Kineosporia corallincola TaxID=2835133 RepID=A0ABS5TDZ7_9ACTN|nr:hypothetical protein [Kineosporia corallincola]MBT0768431.1 hypothetical protein [Kineosporia corallincola]